MSNLGWRKGFGRPITKEIIEERSRVVTETGCWIWIGRVSGNGYGLLKRLNKSMSAHRASYEAFCGEISDGMNILHKCDTKTCVNPDHLYQGTHIQNMQDMKNRGRGYSAFGNEFAKRKINEEKALKIFNSTASNKETAELYGVSKTTVHRIKRKMIWRSIHDSPPPREG